MINLNHSAAKVIIDDKNKFQVCFSHLKSVMASLMSKCYTNSRFPSTQSETHPPCTPGRGGTYTETSTLVYCTSGSNIVNPNTWDIQGWRLHNNDFLGNFHHTREEAKRG